MLSLDLLGDVNGGALHAPAVVDHFVAGEVLPGDHADNLALVVDDQQVAEAEGSKLSEHLAIM